SRHDTGYDSVAGPVNQGMRLAFGRLPMVDASMPEQASAIIAAARAVLEAALAAGRQTTAGGKAIDEHQAHAERLAYSATEVAAAEALVEYAHQRRDVGAGDETTDLMAAAFAAEVADRLRARIEGHREDFGVPESVLSGNLGAPTVAAAIRAAQHEGRFRQIGREVIRARGANHSWMDSEMAVLARDSARQFARKAVAPLAERIHREDLVVPEPIIRQMAELGYFGMSVPEEYGGEGVGDLGVGGTTQGGPGGGRAAAGGPLTRPPDPPPAPP